MTIKFIKFITVGFSGLFIDFSITYFLKDAEPIFNSFICITPEFTQLSASRIDSYSLSRLATIDNSYFIYASNSKKYISNIIIII